MEYRITSSSITKDEMARSLLDDLKEAEGEFDFGKCIFYYKFPTFRNDEGLPVTPSVLFLTERKGLFLFSLSTSAERENETLKDKEKELTELDSILYGKLLKSPILRESRREVRLSVNPLIYAPGAENNPTDLNLVASRSALGDYFGKSEVKELSGRQWEEAISIIEGGKAITRRIDRRSPPEDSDKKCAVILRELEKKIANFDEGQRRAAMAIPLGPQRIRGIAGSGKTIVLAAKVAQLHLDDPTKTILLTFWTKSLYGLLKTLIARFYRERDDVDPDWEKIHILHAWGGRNQPGVYFNACADAGRSPLTFREVRGHQNKNKFDHVCKDLLRFSPLVQRYDHVLIDEGQDLPSSFYRLCFEICKGGQIDRNIIWAYDELQTIMDAHVQDPSKTFGKLEDGTDRIDLDRAQSTISDGFLSHDQVLKKSYRSPGEVLVTAHALGFGLLSGQPVQTLENREHWEDLGYVFEEGSDKPGEKVVIRRPEENSPIQLSSYVDREEIIQVHTFPDFSQELDYIANEVIRFITDGVEPEDILVISMDDRHARNYFSGIAQRLDSANIALNNTQDSMSAVPQFRAEGMVTASTVYKAKGNEAPVVIIAGVDDIVHSLGEVRSRNKLFTALTRSQAWVRLTGIRGLMDSIEREVDKALADYPRMRFVYPDPNAIATIQRDLLEKSQKLRQLRDVALELGLEDVDAEDIRELLRPGSRKKE